MPSLPVLSVGGAGRATAPTPTITYAGSSKFTITDFNASYVYGSTGSPNAITATGASISGQGTQTLTLTPTAAGTAGTATVGARWPKGNIASVRNIGAANATYNYVPGNSNAYTNPGTGGAEIALESGNCSPGWSQSWAQWPNGGNGGPVCIEAYTPGNYVPGNINPASYPMNPGPSGYTLSGTVWYRIW